MLDDAADRLDARRACELLELGELVFAVGRRERARQGRAHARARTPRSARAVSPPSDGHYDSCHARFRPRGQNARARRRPLREPPRSRGDGARPRASCRARRSTTTARRSSGETPRRRSPSPATSTRCRRRRTSRAGSPSDAVHGLGASDMKGGVAVMLELARAEAPARYVFFTREEVPLEESPLPAVFASGVLAGTELAVVLEPTDAILHAGCLGNLQARVEFHGESAHSARPWTGRNAIHELVEGPPPGAAGAARRRARRARLPRGRERSAASKAGSRRTSSRPTPRRSSTSASRPAARATRPRSGCVSSCRTASCTSSTTRRRRHRRSGTRSWSGCASSSRTSRRSRPGRRSRSSPSRESTAINYGPGATAYAHRQDEQIAIANLHAVYETLARFLS